MIRTVLFDLDGTLIDSIELIRRSHEHTLRVHFDRALTPEDWLPARGAGSRAPGSTSST